LNINLPNLAERRLALPALIALYLILAGLFVYVALTRPPAAIETLLIQLVPKTLGLNFLLILIGVYLCRRDIAASVKELWTGDGTTGEQTDPAAGPGWRQKFANPGFYLTVIFLAGLLLVIFVAPQIHRIYYDEDIYGNMAQNIAATGQTGMANYGIFEYGEYFVHWIQYNKDPSGWPFLVSLVFQLFGVNELYMFYLNNLLFAAGSVIVFFITRLVAGGVFPGLLAALVYTLIPHGLVWSNTVAAENPAAFGGGLTVLCTLVYLRTRARRHLYLLAVVFPLACYIRPESALIGLWLIAALAAATWAAPAFLLDRPGTEDRDNLPRPLATREFWALGAIATALLIPHLWHFYAMSGQSWGATGDKFAASFFLHNLSTNGRYYLDNKAFPALFTLLAVIGFLAWRRPGGAEEEKNSFWAGTLIFFWFFLFWGIFLFFYAGSYTYGADVRFALVSFMPLAVLAGLGGEALRRLLEKWTCGRQVQAVTAILLLVLVFSWLKFLPLVRLVSQEAWGARYDHDHAREFIKHIPSRSVVLSHTPTMFLLWGQSAIQTYAGLNNTDLIRDLLNRYQGHVYFHQNYWCSTVNDSNRTVCDGIRLKYNLEPVATAREQNIDFGLYRLSVKD